MKYFLLLAALMALVFVAGVNAYVLKEPVGWGFGILTGMQSLNPSEMLCVDSDNTSSQNLKVYSGPQLTPQSRPDVFIKGFVNHTISGIPTIYHDLCRTEEYLIENLCQRGKYKGLQGITCPYGCDNGVCIVPPGNTCVDTDSGVKYGIQGQTRVCWDDYCLLGGLETCIDAANLTESSCTPEKTIKWTTYECPYGCMNGACVEAPLPVCEGLQMVWEQGRRENYTYATDLCTGYRCLRGNEISPACYNAATCPSACTNGICVFIPEMRDKCPLPITLPQPITTPQPITETVTCLFVLPTKLPVCTSSKGSCTGALGSSSTCAVQVRGSEGETVTWTSDCGRDAKPVTTAINGQNKSVAFLCTKIRMPREPRIPWP